MSHCSYCGGDLSANALYCPKCLVPIAQPPRRRRPGTLSLLLSVSLIFGGPCVWAISGQYRNRILKTALPQTTVHAASIPARPVVDQAEALIRSCGAPDRDVSTANNDPRPPIPFRMLDYGGSHLQFSFVPGGGAKIGDPPPYHWALSGVLDSATNERISLQEAADRMSCVASLTSLADTAPGSGSENDPPPSANADTSTPSTTNPQY